jgi:hypothetical protein
MKASSTIARASALVSVIWSRHAAHACLSSPFTRAADHLLWCLPQSVRKVRSNFFLMADTRCHEQ